MNWYIVMKPPLTVGLSRAGENMGFSGKVDKETCEYPPNYFFFKCKQYKNLKLSLYLIVVVHHFEELRLQEE